MEKNVELQVRYYNRGGCGYNDLCEEAKKMVDRDEMALALAMGNCGAEIAAEESSGPVDARCRWMSALLECGYSEDGADKVIESEVRDWKELLDDNEYARKLGAERVEQFWGPKDQSV